MQRFRFSERSNNKLDQVDENLARVFRHIIKKSPFDLTILEGIRSIERQEELFKSGKSRTMKSKHLKGEALDVGVWDNGKVSWDLEKYIMVADCVNIYLPEVILDRWSLRWGGAWQAKFPNANQTASEMMEEYENSSGGNAFIDAVHWEIIYNGETK